MGLQMRLEDAKDEGLKQGKLEGKLIGLKQGQTSERIKSIKIISESLKNVGVSEDKIFNQLKQQYGKYFSDEKIRKYMK